MASRPRGWIAAVAFETPRTHLVMNSVAIVQARMGSSRLPGKILLLLEGKPILWHVVNRVRSTPGLGGVVVATTHSVLDDPVRDFCSAAGIPCFSGSEHDVLDRFYQAASFHRADPIVRITADCPMIDPEVIEKVLSMYSTGNYDHVGVATGAGVAGEEGYRYPDGLDAECFSFAALQRAWNETTASSDREHVTPYIWRDPSRFRLGVLRPDSDYSMLRWTVDTPADFQLVERVYSVLHKPDKPFHMREVVDYLAQHPELQRINEAAIGNEGYEDIRNVDLNNPGRSPMKRTT